MVLGGKPSLAVPSTATGSCSTLRVASNDKNSTASVLSVRPPQMALRESEGGEAKADTSCMGTAMVVMAGSSRGRFREAGPLVLVSRGRPAGAAGLIGHA